MYAAIVEYLGKKGSHIAMQVVIHEAGKHMHCASTLTIV